jgi:hypothetical protein
MIMHNQDAAVTAEILTEYFLNSLSLQLAFVSESIMARHLSKAVELSNFFEPMAYQKYKYEKTFYLRVISSGGNPV